MMHTVKNITGGILWANLHLLFWLSLIPFASGWLGKNLFEALPLALYGFVLLMAAIAYWILQSVIIKTHGQDSVLAKAIGKDLKGKTSPIIYLIAIAVSFVASWLAIALYIFSALIWLIPDKRIETILKHQE